MLLPFPFIDRSRNRINMLIHRDDNFAGRIVWSNACEHLASHERSRPRGREASAM
jgi:hypothetical protein